MNMPIKRALGPFLIAVFALLVADATPAAAESTWWNLSFSSTPTNLSPGGEGRLTILATDVGDAKEVNAQTEKVKVVDKLPPGVTATAISGQAGFFGGAGPLQCELASLTCEFSGTMPAFQSLEVQIAVKAGPSAKTGNNEVSISGGEAPSISRRRALVVSDEPTKYGVEEYDLRPEEEGGAPTTQAGSHPFQLTTTLALNRVEEPESQSAHPFSPISQALPKDLHFDLPPGLIGNPTPFPQCSDNAFRTDQCPLDTAVGVSVVTVNEPVGLGTFTFPGGLYNLVPTKGEPARFGFHAFVVPVYLDTSVRTGGDYGVTVSVDNISQLASLLSSEVTFWGVPADSRHNNQRGSCLIQIFNENPCIPLFSHRPPPLLTLPTSCGGPWRTTVATDSWSEPGKFLAPVESSFEDELDGCNRLSFSPEIKVTPDGTAASTPTGLTVGVHVPQEESLSATGTAQSTLKDTTVALPPGVAIDPAGADGLLACSQQQIALESSGSPACPDGSKVGTVQIETPLLPDPLEGAVYLAEQNANPFGSLVALYIVAEDPTAGVVVKFAGEVSLDPVTGQVVSTFKNTPQLPFEDLQLHFFGGARAPLATPATCGTYTTQATFSPWSGNPPATPSSSFAVDSGPNGAPCASPLPFAPSLTAGTTSIQAGGFSPFTMTMSREDGNQSLRAVTLRMPPGLLGTLSTVKLCGDAQANAGTCGPESEIGETTVSVGLGGDPFSVKGGKVFITGPYRGAPFGLSIVNPAKAGPFDLGQVIVRAKIEVDPITSTLTIATDDEGPYKIPTILDGIPLQIKHVNVTINRPNFTFNPTNCSPLAIAGSLMSTEGQSGAVTVPFQATNCAVLAFKPHLQASTSGRTSRAKGASLGVKLTYPAGPYDANIKSVKVELPKQLPSRLTTLQKACPASTFTANPASCPAGSIVGAARATTPVLPVPLTGPAYFVSYGGAKFPELVIVLSGYGVTVQLHGETYISPSGITSSTFKTVPDVPVGTFELSLPNGAGSALAANGNLCIAKLRMPTVFTAQNGAQIKRTIRIAPTGCPKRKAHKVTHKRRKGAKGRNGK